MPTDQSTHCCLLAHSGTTSSAAWPSQETSPYSYVSQSSEYGDVLEGTPVEHADMYTWGLEHERTQLEEEYKQEEAGTPGGWRVGGGGGGDDDA